MRKIPSAYSRDYLCNSYDSLGASEENVAESVFEHEKIEENLIAILFDIRRMYIFLSVRERLLLAEKTFNRWEISAN